VTLAGSAVWAVLLRVPLMPPFAGIKFVMDQAAVVALPPKLAPINGIAPGVVDEQVLIAGPGVTVGEGATFIILVSVSGRQGPPPSGSFEVRVNVTVPV